MGVRIKSFDFTCFYSKYSKNIDSKISNFQTKVNGKIKNGHFWYVHFSKMPVF